MAPLHVSSLSKLDTIKDIRVGFDKLVFSAWSNAKASPLVFSDQPPVFSDSPGPKVSSLLFPTQLLAYKRIAGKWAPRKTSGYGRFLRYRHITDQSAASLQIFYQPWRDRMPPFRVFFYATMERLLDLHQVEEQVTALATATGMWLTLAEVEFTVDVPADQIEAEALWRQLWPPWSRKSQWRQDYNWGFHGLRTSPSSIRVYRKNEAGFAVTRMEWILRRARLRQWKCNTLADLRSVPWAERASRALRFVEFHPSRRQSAPLRSGGIQGVYGSVMRLKGVKPAMRDMRPKDQRWAHSRLRPLPLQQRVDAAIEAFAHTLTHP